MVREDIIRGVKIMTTEQINDREYTRLIEELHITGSKEVIQLVEELELVIEMKCIHREVKVLKEDYRAVKEGF